MYRRTGRGRVILLVFLALSIVVITLDFRQDPGPLERAKDISAAILAPIQRGFTAVTRPIGDFFSSLGELGDLRGENARLEDQVADYEEQIKAAQSIQEENERLRSVLGLDEAYLTMDTETAQVIGKVPGNYKWGWQIDKGRLDGIKVDMAVVSIEGLVGKVVRVYDTSAIVIGLIDPDVSASARLEDGRDSGLISGNGADRDLTLDLIGPHAEVTVGDVVITAGLDGGVYPSGIPIGRVTTASGDTASTTQEISVEPYVDFNKLDFVKILLETGYEETAPGIESDR